MIFHQDDFDQEQQYDLINQLINELNIVQILPRAHAIIGLNRISNSFQQNLASFSLTLTSKILAADLQDKIQRKMQTNRVRQRLKEFLEQNEAKNNQLILIFISLFCKLQSVEGRKFAEMRFYLRRYLEKRRTEAEGESPSQRAKILRKIQINERVIQEYFGPEDIQIDAFWIRDVCGDLFTGRQRGTINKPIRRLQIIQQELKYSMTPSQTIQLFLD